MSAQNTPMIQQLWYTAAPFGLSGSPGWQVRAASPALADLASPRLQKLSTLLRYELPAGVRPTSIAPNVAPLSLGFFCVDGEHVLVHRTFVGLTWDKRPGNYFSHLLANLPPGFNARDAIDCWQAPFWKRSDALEPRETVLPTLRRAELEPGPLARQTTIDEQLAAWLSELIVAFLARQPEQRIYVVAQPDTVSALIWGLTRALPSTMLADLTFSTFERQLSSPSAPVIVGTCPAPGQPLNDSLLAGVDSEAVVIDLLRGQTQGLPDSPGARAYADIAVLALVTGSGELDAFFARVEGYQLQDTGALIELLQFFSSPAGHGTTHSSERLFRLLEEHPELFLPDLAHDKQSAKLVQAYLDQLSYAVIARGSAETLLRTLLPMIRNNAYYHSVAAWLALAEFLRKPKMVPNISESLYYDLIDLPPQDLLEIKSLLAEALVRALKASARTNDAINCLRRLYDISTIVALGELVDAAHELGRQSNTYEGLCLIMRFACTEVHQRVSITAAQTELQHLLQRKTWALDAAAAQAIDDDAVRWPGEGRLVWEKVYQLWKSDQQREKPAGVIGRLRSLFGPRSRDQ